MHHVYHVKMYSIRCYTEARKQATILQQLRQLFPACLFSFFASKRNNMNPLLRMVLSAIFKKGRSAHILDCILQLKHLALGIEHSAVEH